MNDGRGGEYVTEGVISSADLIGEAKRQVLVALNKGKK